MHIGRARQVADVVGLKEEGGWTQRSLQTNDRGRAGGRAGDARDRVVLHDRSIDAGNGVVVAELNCSGGAVAGDVSNVVAADVNVEEPVLHMNADRLSARAGIRGRDAVDKVVQDRGVIARSDLNADGRSGRDSVPDSETVNRDAGSVDDKRRLVAG